jgi:hypothetical protein
MTLKTTWFLAVILIALALVPAGAHLFELPNKINLAQDQYFTVQAIYRGWALFGIVLFPAVLVSLMLAIMLRDQRVPFLLSLGAFLCIAATVAIFFIWTYPANQATSNWTVAPADWSQLRSQWEYAHATNAILTFAALCLVTLARLTARE